MYCIYCGRAIPKNSNFCTGCGKPTARKQKRSGLFKCTISILIIVGVSILALVGIKNWRILRELSTEQYLPTVTTQPAKAKSNTVAITATGSTKPQSSDFFVGAWEETYSAYDDPGVFVVHVEFHRDGTTVLWDGYEKSEYWSYYSGTYYVLQDDHTGTVELSLKITSFIDQTELQTHIRVSMEVNETTGLYSLNLCHVSGNEIGVIGNTEHHFYDEMGAGKPIGDTNMVKELTTDEETILETARNVYFEAYGLKVELGAKASDIDNGFLSNNTGQLTEAGRQVLRRIIFPNGMIVFYYPINSGNFAPEGLYGFYLSLAEGVVAEGPIFTDSLGFSVGEYYPDFYNDLSAIVGSNVIDYSNDCSYFRVFFDKEGNTINKNDSDCSIAVEYTFEGSYKTTVLQSVSWQHFDLNKLVNSHGMNEFESQLENRVTGYYTGPTPLPSQY